MHGRRKRDPKIGGRKVPGFRFRPYDSQQVDDIADIIVCSQVEFFDRDMGRFAQTPRRPDVDMRRQCRGPRMVQQQVV